MRLGLFLSFTMHALVLFWALVGIAATKPLPEPPKPEPVVAEIITPGELNKLRQGLRTAKLDDAQPKEQPSVREPPKEAPKPKPVAAEPPPPPPSPPDEKPAPPDPPQVAEPPPPPAPKAAEEPDKEALEKKLEALVLEKAAAEAAEEQRRTEAAARAKAAAEAKAQAEAEAKRKAEEKKKRDIAEAKKRERERKRKEEEAKARAEADAKSKSRIDSDRLSALLDKSPDQPPPPAAAAPPSTPTKARGPVRGDRSGRDAVNSANEASMLLGLIVGKVKACWNIQAGGELAASQVPTIQFDLNPDGSLRGDPRVLNDQGTQHFRLAADAAKSAVIRCQRYELPPDKYEMWKRVTLDFDPREMFQ